MANGTAGATVGGSPSSFRKRARWQIAMHMFEEFAGFGNALLATGDQSYVDVWRKMIETVNSNQKTIDGQVMYPSMYGDDGWYSYTPQPYNQGAHWMSTTGR